mmetsp:Transcript_78835/g.255390  ORF Transcript_78835/g.255390 Transcript_78835/m.255390 type:complete len:92 (-) Transcript_78835:126-401(-)
MGESVSRSCQACWDPEGVANIVRKKKAQRAAINRYSQILDGLEKGDNAKLQDLGTANNEYQQKNDGKFWQELTQHQDWPAVAERLKPFVNS